MKRISQKDRMRFDDRLRTFANSPDDCWNWPELSNSRGYVPSACSENGVVRRFLAHREAYRRLVGPIPEGLQLDHLCRNRRCINPRHLEPVTSRENVLRSLAPSALNAKKTHCKHGHAFTSKNTFVYPTRWGTGRGCRQCRNRVNRETRLRQIKKNSEATKQNP